MTDKPTITIYFTWTKIEPTPLPYWKSILEPTETLKIALDLPLDKEHVQNCSKIISQQIGNQNVDKPILTVKGYNYCIDLLNQTETKTDFSTNYNDLNSNNFIPD